MLGGGTVALAAAATAATAAAVTTVLMLRKRRRQQQQRPPLPGWFSDLLCEPDVERLQVAEWENGTAWRLDNGWLGTDYVHGVDAAVHIAGYALGRTSEGFATLTGAVHFGSAAESHQGLCHGGTMCTVMDDVVGWTGFCVTGQCVPWSGFTVQINTALQAPVRIGSWLKVHGEITKVERRKVSVRASLISPAVDGVDEIVHCTCEGLFVLKK